MKAKIFRVISLLLAVVMALSLASCTSSCKKKKTKKKTNKKPTASAVDSGSYNDDSSVSSDDFDDSGDGDVSEPEYNIIIARPQKDSDMKDGVATGEKLVYKDGEDDDDDDPTPEPDVPDINDDDTDFDPSVCEEIIPKYGEGIERGNRTPNRTVNVHNDKVTFTNFDGYGCNVYPTYSTLYAQIREDDNKAYFDLLYKRFNDVTARYARSWFQIDWMVTDEAGKDFSKYDSDPEKNPDYINYKNGKYWLSKDNELMESCIDYWKMLDDAGTKMYVSFGWKVGTRVQSWFSEDVSRPRISAPKDLDLYAKAAEQLFLYCQDRGLDNMDVIAFYNEAHRVEDSEWRSSWDYTTIGDKRVYWANMVKKVHDRFKANDRLKDVKIASCDGSGELDETSEKYLTVYLKNRVPDLIDIHTIHAYANLNMNSSKDDAYTRLYEAFLTIHYLYSPNQDGKNAYDFMATEMYAFGYDAGEEADVSYYTSDMGWEDRETYWNVSTTAYFIAAANTGVKSAFTWGMCGGMLVDPSSFCVANNFVSAWILPNDTKTSKYVRSFYYEYAILNNYVPTNANVHNVDWVGNDYRVSAFSSADGKDFAMVIEKSYDTKQLTFDINLDKSLGGKDVYIYKLINDPDLRTIQATIPHNYTKLTGVEKSIDFTEASTEVGEYTVYVISTIKPLKQIELYNADTGEQAVSTDLSITKKGDPINLKALLIDSDGADVDWSISMYYNAPKKVTNKNNAPKISYYYQSFNVTEYKSVRRHETAGSDMGTLTVDSADSKLATYMLPADVQIGDSISIRCTYKDSTPNDTKDDRYAVAIINVVA